jgi:hypothetical protein
MHLHGDEWAKMCNFHEPWAPKPQEGGDVAFSLRCNKRGVNMVWQENLIIDIQHRFLKLVSSFFFDQF